MIKWKIVSYRNLDEALSQSIGKTSCLYQQVEFLRAVAPGKAWLACLQMGSETWFFPFTGQKWLWKWRIFRVSFCPYFMPFGSGPIPEAIWEAWFRFLNQNTWQQDWCFQTENHPVSMLQPDNVGVSLQAKTNLVLDLNAGFDSVFQNWKGNRKAAWKKRSSIVVEKTALSQFPELLDQMAKRPRSAWFPSQKEIQMLKRLMGIRSQGIELESWLASSEEEMLSLVLLAHFRGRIHYLFSVSTQAGFKAESLTALLGTVFQSHRGVFDFEGSSIPGVKAFFNSFGAREQPYYGIKKGA